MVHVKRYILHYRQYMITDVLIMLVPFPTLKCTPPQFFDFPLLVVV